MNPTTLILICSAVLIIFVLAKYLLSTDKESKATGIINEKTKRSFRVDQISEMINRKASRGKVYKIETMCLQAGFHFKYSGFITLRVCSVFICAAVCGLLVRSLYMVIIGLGIGWFAPTLIIQFIRNLRLNRIDEQMCSFLNLLTERYKSNNDINQAMMNTLKDFEGNREIHNEISQTVTELNLDISAYDAFTNLAKRTGNEYIKRFRDAYEMTRDIGMGENGQKIISQPYLQYQESRDNLIKQKKAIQEPVTQAYIVIAMVPVVAIFQSVSSPSYVDFMTTNTVGQIGTAVVVAVVLAAVAFTNLKIGAPIQKRDRDDF